MSQMYQISVFDKDGLMYHEAGFEPLGISGEET